MTPPPPDRRPVLAALAVVLRGQEVLLVRRANPPDQGFWGFPGGKVEWGEPIFRAAERELLEETGVSARARAVLGSQDLIQPGPAGAAGSVGYHMYLVGVACDWQAGEPVAADDALEAGWFPVEEVTPDRLEMSEGVDLLLAQALTAET
ncbi:MAG: NUDIX hydrolase [Paracoccaceae bacterium]